MTATIAEPETFQAGIYDIPEDVYHADPVPGGSLSCSGAKWLLPPSVPAKYAYYREHPKPPTAAMEWGTAAHKMVLGIGQPVVKVDAEHRRKEATQEREKEIRAEGGIPLLAKDYQTVQDMAEALWRDPLASALLSPDRGDPERSVFWTDPEFGIWRRSRLDLLPNPSSGRLLISDYKTCVSADREAISKAAWNFGYYRQSPWYCDAVSAMYPGADVTFLFIFQEKEPPYLVNVIALAAVDIRAGREANRRAMATFAECTASGEWPGYTHGLNDIEVISLPPWARAA